MCAAQTECLQVRDLLDGGMPPNSRDRFGNTPLIVACQNGHAKASAIWEGGAAVLGWEGGRESLGPIAAFARPKAKKKTCATHRCRRTCPGAVRQVPRARGRLGKYKRS